MHESLLVKAVQNVRGILSEAIEYTSSERALVVYDTHDGLAQLIVAAYREALPEATFVDFDTQTKEEIIAQFDSLEPRDLVVLIQSSDFRLNEFRIRIHLFQRKLKVIDHLHLSRNTPDSRETYVDALRYDKEWYRGMGSRLKHILEHTEALTVEGGNATLTLHGGLEVPKLNVGDYRNMDNVGGTFPIGEVFTEGKDLTRMDGSLTVFAFAGPDFHTRMYEPFQVTIREGLVVSWANNAPPEFAQIVTEVGKHERPIIREVGFGLNRAITRERPLRDITAFERMLGLHFSLGEKHTVYKKPGITADKTRYHVDLFPTVDRVYADDVLIFEHGTYSI